MYQMLTCGPHDHQHSPSLNIQQDQKPSPWDTIIQVLECELHIEEYSSQPYGVIPLVYRSMIGSLLYLCASRPDIMLSVCMCARFQATPKESHHKAVKHIL